MYWRRGLFSSLLATKREHWYHSLLMLLFASVGGLAPLWLGFIAYSLFGKSVALVDFASNGEFALYCAATVAPTLYLILHERAARLDGQTLLALIAVVVLLVSVAAYAVVVPVPSRLISNEFLDREFYATATLILFVVGAAFAFLIAALDLSRTNPAVQQIAESDQRELRAKYEEMGGDS